MSHRRRWEGGWRFRPGDAPSLSAFVLDAAVVVVVVVVHRCGERVSEEDRADYHLKKCSRSLRSSISDVQQQIMQGHIGLLLPPMPRVSLLPNHDLSRDVTYCRPLTGRGRDAGRTWPSRGCSNWKRWRRRRNADMRGGQTGGGSDERRCSGRRLCMHNLQGKEKATPHDVDGFDTGQERAALW